MRATQVLFGPRLRRMQLTTKSARKGYYKGTGVGILGAWDKKNPRKFIVDWDKVKTYVVPKYTEPVAELTPFVSKRISAYEEHDDGTWTVPKKKLTGEDYLEMWKRIGFDEASQA